MNYLEKYQKEIEFAILEEANSNLWDEEEGQAICNVDKAMLIDGLEISFDGKVSFSIKNHSFENDLHQEPTTLYSEGEFTGELSVHKGEDLLYSEENESISIKL